MQKKITETLLVLICDMMGLISLVGKYRKMKIIINFISIDLKTWR